MRGTVTVDDDGVVTGSGAALQLFNRIQTEEELDNPLPDPNVPDPDFDGHPQEWKQAVEPLIVRVKKGWARTAREHAYPFGGALSGTKVPLISSLTKYYSSDTATATEGPFGIHMTAPSDGAVQNVQGLDEAASGTYSFRVLIHPLPQLVTYPMCGVYLRNSATGELLTWALTFDVGGLNLAVDPWIDAANPDTRLYGPSTSLGLIPYLWLGITDDGTNHKFQYSTDGEHYYTVFSQSRTAYLANGGDRRGIMLRAYTSVAAATFGAWEIGAP